MKWVRSLHQALSELTLKPENLSKNLYLLVKLIKITELFGQWGAINENSDISLLWQLLILFIFIFFHQLFCNHYQYHQFIKFIMEIVQYWILL